MKRDPGQSHFEAGFEAALAGDLLPQISGVDYREGHEFGAWIVATFGLPHAVAVFRPQESHALDSPGALYQAGTLASGRAARRGARPRA